MREGLNLIERGAESVAFDLDVVAILEVQPEALAGAEVSCEPERRVGGDAAFAVDDLVDSSRWHAEGHRKAMLGDLEGL